MTFWTPPAGLEPKIDLLQRRWNLPAERTGVLKRLIQNIDSGSTALAIPASEATTDWGAALTQDPGTATAPLVLLEAGNGHRWVQTWRHNQAERAIAANLAERLRQPPTTPAALTLIGNDSTNDLQREAIRVALSHAFSLITGGPGTGKTFTLARILALLAHDARSVQSRALRVRLAAPTGKAADRMREAVSHALDSLPDVFDQTIRADLKAAAGAACSLHALLGFNPALGRCSFNAQKPLPCDAVIVDEASMADTFVWAALLRALPKTARLIVLGDPHQLESVDEGDVLGSLVRTAGRLKPLKDVWVRLTESHRFRERKAIGALAEAIVGSDAAAAQQVLENATSPDALGVQWIPGTAHRLQWKALPEPVRSRIVSVAEAATPEEALKELNTVRILTAHRAYGVGALALSESINVALAHEIRGAARPHNVPVIINRNDPETGLKNGAVGVVVTGTDGVRRAWFPAIGPGEPPRSFSITQLPDHSPAWALTIHRSQGSEFEHVLVVLPAETSPLATRELIYTAITRARHNVYLHGEKEAITKAISDPSFRTTCLEPLLLAATQ